MTSLQHARPSWRAAFSASLLSVPLIVAFLLLALASHFAKADTTTPATVYPVVEASIS